jgi:hypothetical protein
VSPDTLRETFPAIPTCEIEPPVVETENDPAPLPRVLLQVAGGSRAVRRVLALTGLFALLILIEIALFFRIPQAGMLVVYGEEMHQEGIHEKD